jgi:DeoR/GlpR family transcriptional regulator of sugar metabolism
MTTEEPIKLERIDGKDKKQTGRRKFILDLLDRDKSARVADLSDKLGVSVVTIRKDLEAMESEGLLSRNHGGAVKNALSLGGADYEGRKRIKSDEKKKIAAAAAALVRDGDYVIMNAGSTTAFVCEELKKGHHVTIITNALHLLNDLASSANVTTFFLGGRLDSEMKVTVGDDVCEQLMKYTADKLIMGVDGIDIKSGVTTYNHVEDYIYKQMLAQAKERILVADDSKIGKVTFARFASLSDFHAIVTNYTEKNAGILQKMESMGIKVIAV